MADLGDNYFIGLALAQAEEAARRGEIPIGAVLVCGDQVYSAGANEREATHDPTAHAEVVALRHAAEALRSWRLSEATLYVTAEPCVLCTGAIHLARVPRVIFGCPNPKGGALRFVSEHARTLGLTHSVDIVSGVRELECAQLLKGFFRERRQPERRDGRVVEGA